MRTQAWGGSTAKRAAKTLDSRDDRVEGAFDPGATDIGSRLMRKGLQLGSQVSGQGQQTSQLAPDYFWLQAWCP